MIGPNHPVREAFSDCSTGNNGGKYYDSKEIAFAAFNAVLKRYGYCLDCMDQSGDSGYRTVAIWKSMPGVIGYAYFTWYNADCRRWDVTGYIT